MERFPEETDLKEFASEARSCLNWVLSGMGISSEIEVFIRDGQVLLNVLCGENSNIVIGRKGQTLEALQTLVCRIVAKRYSSETKSAKILIDVEGYRERRRLNLVDLAKRTAEGVRETGEATFLSPLNSYERYIVHDALKNEPGIVSSSRGEGGLKQILIAPAEQKKG